MEAGLCMDGKRRINHVSSVTSYLMRHLKQKGCKEHNGGHQMFHGLSSGYLAVYDNKKTSFVWERAAGSEEKYCTAKKRRRKLGKMLLQSFYAFVHRVFAKKCWPINGQRRLGSVGLHNYWNVIEIAIWPSAISKSRELQFFDEGKMCDNIIMN